MAEGVRCRDAEIVTHEQANAGPRRKSREKCLADDLEAGALHE